MLETGQPRTPEDVVRAQPLIDAFYEEAAMSVTNTDFHPDFPEGLDVGASGWSMMAAHPDCWMPPWRGIVISRFDPRIWRETLAFPRTWPTAEQVQQHREWMDRRGYRLEEVGVLWRPGQEHESAGLFDPKYLSPYPVAHQRFLEARVRAYAELRERWLDNWVIYRRGSCPPQVSGDYIGGWVPFQDYHPGQFDPEGPLDRARYFPWEDQRVKLDLAERCRTGRGCGCGTCSRLQEGRCRPMRCQRWRAGDPFWVDPAQCIRTRDYDVAEIPGDAVPKAFITTHHYARSYCSARYRFGLYRRGDLVGVCVYGWPTHKHTVTNHFGEPWERGTELSRLVLLPEVPGNGESWFVQRTFALLRRKEELDGIASFCDPMARTRADGIQVKPGHIGIVYQALNAVVLPRSEARWRFLTPAGTEFSNRAYRKVVGMEQGWRYACRQLLGYVPDPEDARRLVEEARTHLRRVHHPGNLKYGWKLDRRQHRYWQPLLPAYPKKEVLC